MFLVVAKHCLLTAIFASKKQVEFVYYIVNNIHTYVSRGNWRKFPEKYICIHICKYKETICFVDGDTQTL